MRVPKDMSEAACFVRLVEDGPALYSARGEPLVLGERVGPKEFAMCQLMAMIAEDPAQKDPLAAIQCYVEVHNEGSQLPASGEIVVKVKGGTDVILV